MVYGVVSVRTHHWLFLSSFVLSPAKMVDVDADESMKSPVVEGWLLNM